MIIYTECHAQLHFDEKITETISNLVQEFRLESQYEVRLSQGYLYIHAHQNVEISSLISFLTKLATIFQNDEIDARVECAKDIISREKTWIEYSISKGNVLQRYLNLILDPILTLSEPPPYLFGQNCSNIQVVFVLMT